MGIVTTYNEAGVKEYMETVLGDTAHKLGWSVAGDDFDEPVNEVLYTLSEADFSFVDTQAEARKVRMVARMEVWRAAMYYTAHEASHSAGAPGTGQTTRSQIHTQCKAMFELAYGQFTEAYPELSVRTSREVERTPISYTYDYYGNAE